MTFGSCGAIAAGDKLKKHEAERLRRIRENPPQEFICGAWFDQICDYLQVDPAATCVVPSRIPKCAQPEQRAPIRPLRSGERQAGAPPFAFAYPVGL